MARASRSFAAHMLRRGGMDPTDQSLVGAVMSATSMRGGYHRVCQCLSRRDVGGLVALAAYAWLLRI